MDLFIVPTIGFDLLYAFIIVQLDRWDRAWINVTTNPASAWVTRQITEAFPWDEAPGLLGRGGSARLRPLTLADGLVCIPADVSDLMSPVNLI